MKQNILRFFIVLCLLNGYNSAKAQLAKCKGKYFGNIIAGSVPSNYSTYWNQVTSENGSKWGSVEGTQGVYNFGNSDLAYNWAKNNNGLFKYHNLIWGAQTPGWVNTAATATITNNINPYFQAVRDHYAPMGGLKMIDVLNEPVNTSMPGNLKAALTAGYQAEPANANDKNNQYGWAIWCFQVARKYFPDATLLINEYNVEMNWNNCRAPYIAMVQAIKNAPNLTDGQKNLIDGVGLQCHGVDNLTAANFKACIDEIWTKTGVAIHITEFDQTANPNEAKQQSVYSTLIPVAWEHPHVAGITLWGYIQGSTWIGGNGVAGPGGTDSGLLYKSSYTTNPLGERPAMTWLKSYLASQPSLSCCPPPAPFAACNGNAPPSVSITSPATNAAFTAPASINLTATASDADGTISNVEFFNGTTKLGEDATSPYTYSWTNVAAGTYTITAVATDNSGNKTTSTAITIKVNVPQGPYNGTAHVIPGTIQVEAFDVGGNGFAYYDGTPGSETGVNFRTTEDVDIENCTDAGGGYNIGWATAGEWLEYTVNVQTTGTYTMDLRVACNGDGRTLSVSMDGTNIAGNVSIPNTGDWQAWQTVSVNNISLTAGQKIMRLTIGATDYINLNYVTFTLSQPPVATITASGSTIFCTGGSVVLNAGTGTGYTYLWKRDGTTITNATSSSYTATQSGSYTVTVSANNQTTTSNAVSVTVNAIPNAPVVSSSVSYCQNASATQLTATGSNLKWYTVPSGGTSSTTATTPSTAIAGTTNYYVSQTTNGCESSRAMIAVTVNAVPDAPVVSSSVSYCQNASAAQLTATGSNLKWYTVPSGGTSSTIAPTPSTATSGTTNYYVSQTTNGCESSRATIAVTVNAFPVITPYVQVNGGSWSQQNTAQLCAGGSILLGPQPVSATGWSWTGPNGFTSSSREISLTTISSGQDGVYTASYTSNGCISTEAFTITVNSLPSAPVVSSSVSYCQNASATQLTATGSNLKWYTVPSGGTSSTTAPTPSTATAGTTNYYVSQTTSGCESSRATIAVTVNAVPNTPVVSSPVSYCQNASATQLTATGSNLKWYIVPGGGTSSTTAPIPSTATTGTTNYYVSQTTNGCESSRAVIEVTINSLPDAVITPSGPTTFVEGGSVTLNANTGAGLSYKWLKGALQVGTGSSYEVISTGSYAVEVANASGCKATSAAVNVTANQNQSSVITIVSPVPNSTVTGPITITITVSDPDGGITKVEYLDGTTVIGTSDVSPYNFTWDNPSAGDHVITVRVTDSNGGVTTSSPVIVTSGVSTGVHAASEMQGVVYPNPSNGEMTIETSMDLTNAKVTVVDVLGEEVELPSTVNGKGAIVDVSILAEGTYLLIVRQENRVLRKKITIIK